MSRKRIEQMLSCKRNRHVHEHLSVQSAHLVEARLEVEALAVLVHRPQVPVKGSLVAVRPPTLSGRAAALENVLQLLLSRSAPEDRFTQGELRRKAPGDS